jgi:histidinol-phosphate aminotransferase
MDASLALPHIARLHAYTPGLQPGESGWVKLNTNECPYPPSPRVAEAIRREVGEDGASLRLYPNPKSSPLRAAVARLHAAEAPQLAESNVIIGNGSDDILNLLVRAFVGPTSAGDGARSREQARSHSKAAKAGAGEGTGSREQARSHSEAGLQARSHSEAGAMGAGEAARSREQARSHSEDAPQARSHSEDGAPAAGFTLPSYSLYPVLVEIQDGRANVIEFDRSLRLPVERMAASKARAFFLTSPNAPTGVGFANADLERVLVSYRGLLVVDEAYAPFARENALPLLARHANLIVVRTLSKAYALAGIRVGYALAHADIIDVLDRVRDSYNVSRLSQVAALAALGDQPYYAGVIAKVKATRDAFIADLLNRRGWKTYDSQSNFVFTEPKDARGETGPAVALAAYRFLFARQVLVRHFPSHALTAPFLRISVGTDAEMRVLSETLDAWQKA